MNIQKENGGFILKLKDKVCVVTGSSKGIGKAIAKYDLPMFESVCLEFLNHKDVATKGTGLDIMSKNKYPSLISKVQEISEDKKAGVNQTADSGYNKETSFSIITELKIKVLHELLHIIIKISGFPVLFSRSVFRQTFKNLLCRLLISGIIELSVLTHNDIRVFLRQCLI